MSTAREKILSMPQANKPWMIEKKNTRDVYTTFIYMYVWCNPSYPDASSLKPRDTLLAFLL